MKYKVAVISVVPSPYQRDLFAAIASRPDVELQVYYLEAASPDSPWPVRKLAPYEKVLPGFWIGFRGARVHFNWSLPELGEFDIVVINTLMSLTAQWLMRGELKRRPWIFLGERLSSRRRRWHDWLSAPLHRASAIAAIGTWAQEDYHKRFSKPHCANLPYVCDLSGFVAQPRRAPGAEVVFLFCGQMIARKGIDQLIDAFSKLKCSRLLLVGREADLPCVLDALPDTVRQRIEYLGFHPPENLPALFAMADVFVLPSRYDGWGVVINQAIAAGLPVICSDQVGAGYDLVSDQVNGFIFQADNADDLLRVMRHFEDHPEIIAPMGEASRREAAHWTPTIAAGRWVELFAKVSAS